MEVPGAWAKGRAGPLGTRPANAALAGFQERFLPAQHLISTPEGKARESQLIREARVQSRGAKNKRKNPL